MEYERNTNMIYCDGKYLVSTCGADDLHRFATRMAIPKEQFVSHGIPHYVVNVSQAGNCWIMGARYITLKGMVRMIRNCQGVKER